MLQFIKHRLGEPRLWHFNKDTIPAAIFAGIFAGFLPIPFQMVVAAFLSVRLRCNLPIAVTLVWFSNPFTYVPVFYPAYKLGAWMLGMSTIVPHPIDLGWVFQQLIPLWLGSICCGLLFGGAGYLLTQSWWRRPRGHATQLRIARTDRSQDQGQKSNNRSRNNQNRQHDSSDSKNTD